jgi:membrane-associated phospholipid phosphatase
MRQPQRSLAKDLELVIDRRFRSRHLVIAFAFCCSILTTGILHGQEVAPGTSSSSPDDPAQTSGSAAEWRDVSLRRLPSNFLSDQKDLWLFPAKLAHGQHWLPTIAVVGVTAGLLAADPHDVSYFRRTTTFHGFNRVMSGRATTLEIGLVPVAFYGIGLIRKRPYTEKTALLAGEAFADSLVVYGVINAVTRRLRPSDIPPQGPFSDTFFRHKSVFGNSFPSGHTIEAFAVATVIARRYKNHRWVPWVAYGVAGTIAFSRVTLQSHFPADVFLGAALGYSISRFSVLHGH